MSMISKTTHTKDKKNVVKVNHYTQALASESNCYVFNNLLAGSACNNTCEANVPKLVGYNDLLSNNILYYSLLSLRQSRPIEDIRGNELEKIFETLINQGFEALFRDRPM